MKTVAPDGLAAVVVNVSVVVSDVGVLPVKDTVAGEKLAVTHEGRKEVTLITTSKLPLPVLLTVTR